MEGGRHDPVDKDFDDQLRAWAELGDERLPADYLNAALAQIDPNSPARAPLAGWRFPQMNRFATRLRLPRPRYRRGDHRRHRPPGSTRPTSGRRPCPRPSDEASQEPDATAAGGSHGESRGRHSAAA